MKKFIPVIVSFLFMFIVGLSYLIQSSTWNSTLAEQQSEIYSLQSNIELKNTSKTEQQNTVIKNTTGLNTERVAKDNEIASNFLRKIMTWDSYDEYTKIRQDLMETYKLTEDSNFMTIFMPAVVNRESNDGTVYNRIDTLGLNVTYESMDSYVTKINTDVYTYFAFVEWSSSDKNGAEASTTSIFTYSINSDGEIFDIDAHTIQY